MPEEIEKEQAVVEAKETKKEFLAEQDKHVLDMVKMQQALATANAEKALLNYNNVVLQLTIKYQLSQEDSITEQGEIVRKAK